MHTIKLEVGENIYEHIMYLLKSINSSEIKIVEENKKTDTKTNIKNLLKSKNIDMFSDIKDPLDWQEKQRQEW